MSDYYVYVYIDPRNYEEFYFGKGRGTRKNAHLHDTSDSEKATRIKSIQKDGLQPIIRVIAKNLSNHDALLVEKTLLWKLGRLLTNVSSGHYARNFRPHNTMHLELADFDFQNGLYYYNVGEGPHRHWDDFRTLGYISAGHADRFRDAMLGFRRGDVFAAYLKRHGFVGIGKILAEAVPFREARIRKKALKNYDLRPSRVSENSASMGIGEYVCRVNWLAKVKREDAKWKRNFGLYTTTHVRASLDNQPETIKFLEDEFGISMRDHIA
jgi:hypothetical protein